MDSPRPQHFFRREPPQTGFDFTLHIRRLCDDMVQRLEQLRHIDMSRVAVSFSQTRRTGSHGMFASLTPLRFAGGQMHTFRRKRRWGIQRVYGPDGREMLYILSFYLPRFLDLPFREKLTTTLHELWHIGPQFDGDLRRLGGRCFAHGSSQKRYDAHIAALLDRWLALDPPGSLYDFLRLSFRELTAGHGRVFGRRVPVPKLVPLDR
jgi:predicted metallopeptidase